MGKTRGVGRRKRKKPTATLNHKKMKKKIRKKPVIECKQIAKAWVGRKSLLTNFTEMGLSSDPNKTIRIKNLKHKQSNEKTSEQAITQVVKSLEEEAATTQPNALQLPNELMKLCVYMAEKHGNDYSAMARDPQNYYQETPRWFSKTIAKLTKIPRQWNAYQRAKDAIEKTEHHP